MSPSQRCGRTLTFASRRWGGPGFWRRDDASGGLIVDGGGGCGPLDGVGSLDGGVFDCDRSLVATISPLAATRLKWN